MNTLIQILVLALATYPVSLAIAVPTAMDLVKDIANEGYIFDGDFLANYKSTSNLSELAKYPFFNMLVAMFARLSYTSFKDEILLYINTTGCLEKMSKEDVETYAANPTASTALTLSNAHKIRNDFKNVLKEKIVKGDVEYSIGKNNHIDISVNIDKENEKLIKQINNDNNIVVQERIENIIEDTDSKENEYVIKSLNIDIQDTNTNEDTKDKPKTRSLLKK